jgi:hypothetical protein
MQPRSTVSAALLFTSLALHAQTAPVPSTVEIRITDTSGVGIPDAELTAIPAVAAPTTSAKADGFGAVTLSLASGSYNITARATGFATTTTEFHVPIDAQIRTTLTLQVESGGCGVCVTVVSEVPLIPAPPLTATIHELPLSGKFPLRPVKFRR